MAVDSKLHCLHSSTNMASDNACHCPRGLPTCHGTAYLRRCQRLHVFTCMHTADARIGWPRRRWRWRCIFLGDRDSSPLWQRKGTQVERTSLAGNIWTCALDSKGFRAHDLRGNHVAQTQ
eukprot:6482963-Amphidinium_carterae.1